MPKIQVHVRFYGRLNDFLRPPLRRKNLHQKAEENTGLIDFVQSLGVPHGEVGKILVNGCESDLAYRVGAADKIRIWPAKIASTSRFILDVHLGKLAKYLRIVGFDAAYRNDWPDPLLIRQARHEKRLILTRDLGLLKNRKAHGYWVRNELAPRQLREILSAFDLHSEIRPFRFCLECNGRLVPVKKKEILSRLLPLTRKYYRKFHRCVRCGKIYWAGSHYRSMRKFIRKLGIRNA